MKSKRSELALYRFGERLAREYEWCNRKVRAVTVYTWHREYAAALAPRPVHDERSHALHLSEVLAGANEDAFSWSPRSVRAYTYSIRAHGSMDCPGCKRLLELAGRPDGGLVTVLAAETGISTWRHVLAGGTTGVLVSGGATVPTAIAISSSMSYVILYLGLSVGSMTGAFLGMELSSWRAERRKSRAAVTFDLVAARTPLELRTRDAVLGVEEAQAAESESSSDLLALARAGRDLDAELREIVLSAALIARLTGERDAAVAAGVSVTDQTTALTEAEESLTRRLDALDRYLADLGDLRSRVRELEAHTQVEGLDLGVAELLTSAAKDDEATRRLDELSADTRALVAGVSEIVEILAGKNALPPASVDPK